MKRRDFGLLAGTSLATAAVIRPTQAKAADPSLLDTTLTPLGGERAGNAGLLSVFFGTSESEN
jgi:hypothetical protein